MNRAEEDSIRLLGATPTCEVVFVVEKAVAASLPSSTRLATPISNSISGVEEVDLDIIFGCVKQMQTCKRIKVDWLLKGRDGTGSSYVTISYWLFGCSQTQNC